MLLDSKENALRRFAARWTSAESGARAACEFVHDPGPAELALMYDRLLDTIAGRPAVRTIRSVEGQIEQTYQDLLAAVG